MAVLAIYTNSFPYGTAETFLETEIKFLSAAFEKIYVIPRFAKPQRRELPVNVQVLRPIVKKEWGSIRLYLAGILRLHKFFTLRGLLKPGSLKCIKYLGYGFLSKKKLEKLIPEEVVLHYSYWLDYNAFALCMLKREERIGKLVSRAHGFDLYEERGEKGLSFLKPAIIGIIDRIFLISEHGRNYLSERFPANSGKFNVSRLGITDPRSVNPQNEKAFLTLVSCSSIDPNKRISVIYESLKHFRDKFPLKKLSWYHIGAGKELAEFIQSANSDFTGSNVSVYFRGQMKSAEIAEFYRTVPADLFINISISEGISVSVMEAMSFSIPAAATAIGGTPEIVNNENGFLLSPGIGPEELCEFLSSVFDSKNSLTEKRSAARETWNKSYNAEVNYRNFAGELLSLA